LRPFTCTSSLVPFLLQERVAGGGPLTPSNAGVQVRAVPRNCEYVLFLLPSLTCLLFVAFFYCRNARRARRVSNKARGSMVVAMQVRFVLCVSVCVYVICFAHLLQLRARALVCPGRRRRELSTNVQTGAVWRAARRWWRGRCVSVLCHVFAPPPHFLTLLLQERELGAANVAKAASTEGGLDGGGDAGAWWVV